MKLLGVLDRDMKEFEHTKKLKQSGNYVEFIEDFQPTCPLMWAYPSDDQCSLEKLASGGNFECWYNYQFVQNEEMHVYFRPKVGITIYLAEHMPILAGTMTGVVIFDEHNNYTFFVSASGGFYFTAVGENPDNLIFDASLNLQTGELTLEWNGVEPKVIINYEYNLV